MNNENKPVENEKTKTLADVAETMRLEELEDLKQVTEDLKKVLPKPATISKEEFEIYFLPFFIGEVERNDTNTQIFIYNYLEKTEQSYHRELEVVNEEGDVLYILPPLFIDVFIKNEDLSISFLTKKMSALIESGYYNSDKEIVKGLNEILKSLGADNEKYRKYIIEFNRMVLDYKDRFIRAYKRRKGLPIEEEEQTKDKKETKRITNVDTTIDEEDDIFDY